MNKALKSALLGSTDLKKAFASPRLLLILPVALSLAACAGNQQQSSQQTKTVITDSSGRENTSFADGFDSMKAGNNGQARRDLAVAYAASPNDPYEQLAMGAAYQNTGAMAQAVPLYRQVMLAQNTASPNPTTLSDDRGLTLKEIAQRNCEKGGLDRNCNAQSQAMIVPAAGGSHPEKKAFEVFFDFNRSTISPETAATLRQAAQYSTDGNLTHINIVGHTDSVGTQAYNRALSERRASEVEQELQRDGLPAGAMIARGVGENGQLIATADNVRERQNRRVEIVVEESLVN